MIVANVGVAEVSSFSESCDKIAGRDRLGKPALLGRGLVTLTTTLSHLEILWRA
jgi:hypothetical protein